jgi:phosphatidate cytidylyltransferase
MYRRHAFGDGNRGRHLVGDAVRSVAAGLMAFVVTVMGFVGGLIMSAIKRDRGVKDYGSLIEGHGGILDRIDSLCFAAPVFFHLTRFFFVP